MWLEFQLTFTGCVANVVRFLSCEARKWNVIWMEIAYDRRDRYILHVLTQTSTLTLPTVHPNTLITYILSWVSHLHA